MPTIKLTDQLGLDVEVQPAPMSALLKYASQLPSLRLDSLDLSKVGGLTLDQPAIRSLSTGVSLDQPIDLGADRPTLSVGGGAHASIQVIDDAGDLPAAADLPPDACYVAFGMDASVSADVNATVAGVEFGASPSSTMELTSYSRFAKNGPGLLDAIRQTVAAFAVPLRSADLEGLPAGQITQCTVSGTLELSGSVDLFATANPLAAASLPAPLPGVSVSAGGSANVGLSCEIEGEYEIVAHKLDTGNVRLAWRTKKATEVSVHATASEGLAVALGSDEDVFAQVVRLISADPQADVDELARAGVSEDQAAAIQAAVKAAAARKLEIAVGAELTAGVSDSTAFQYEIAPAALNAESRKAIDRALRGDLAPLHAKGLSGITCTRSAWDNVRKQGLEFDVNLLGFLNYRSIAKLAIAGSVLYEPATGALSITDRATAERIRSTQLNFVAETEKLRHVLAESFLITAAYRGAKQVVGPPSMRCSHSFFELDVSTSRAEMTGKLRTGVALGLLTGAEAAPPEGVADFARTLFSVATDYDEELVERMFLDAGGSPLPREPYEAAGRYAIQYVVQEGDDDAVRRRPAIEDALWARMKDAGQPGFAALFPGVPAPYVGAITADYSTVQWWADAMSGMGRQLVALRSWLARNPNAKADEPEYEKQRQSLAKYLRDVAANTREEFGRPWGLIAMNQVAGRRAGAKLLVTGPRFTISKSRALAAVTGP
jgi:hypothetical protein